MNSVVVASTLHEVASSNTNICKVPMESVDSVRMDRHHQSTPDSHPTEEQKWDEESTMSCSTVMSCSTAMSSSAESEMNEHTIRKVRFAEKGNNDKGVSRATVLYQPWTANEVSASWYNRVEYEQFKVQFLVDTDAVCQSDYHKHFMQIYNACGDKSLESKEKNESVTKNGASFSIYVAESEFRGIERRLYCRATMKHMRQDCVVQSMLDLQRDCYNNIVEVDDDERAAKLATLSLQNSRRTRRISYLLAFGDSIVAQSA